MTPTALHVYLREHIFCQSYENVYKLLQKLSYMSASCISEERMLAVLEKGEFPEFLDVPLKETNNSREIHRYDVDLIISAMEKYDEVEVLLLLHSFSDTLTHIDCIKLVEHCIKDYTAVYLIYILQITRVIIDERILNILASSCIARTLFDSIIRNIPPGINTIELYDYFKEHKDDTFMLMCAKFEHTPNCIRTKLNRLNIQPPINSHERDVHSDEYRGGLKWFQPSDEYKRIMRELQPGDEYYHTMQELQTVDIETAITYVPPARNIISTICNAMLDNRDDVFLSWMKLHGCRLNPSEKIQIIECALAIDEKKYIECLCHQFKDSDEIIQCALRIGNLDMLIFADSLHCKYDRVSAHLDALIGENEDCVEYVDFMISRDCLNDKPTTTSDNFLDEEYFYEE